MAGYELCPLVQEQAANCGAAFELAEVERVERAAGGWAVTTAEGDYQARAVIVASGSRPRPLAVPGAERLAGRGVSHCASCDGAFMRGGTVGVVGGGDSALQEALALTEYAARVIVLHRGAGLSAQQTYQQRIFEHPAIEYAVVSRSPRCWGRTRLAACAGRPPSQATPRLLARARATRRARVGMPIGTGR